MKINYIAIFYTLDDVGKIRPGGERIGHNEDNATTPLSPASCHRNCSPSICNHSDWIYHSTYSNLFMVNYVNLLSSPSIPLLQRFHSAVYTKLRLKVVAVINDDLPVEPPTASSQEHQSDGDLSRVAVGLPQPAGQRPAFKHKELSRNDTEICLIRILPRTLHAMGDTEIQCELFCTNVERAPHYKAFSYNWGDASNPHHLILLNGYAFVVRQNLWETLNHFQPEIGELIIWIEAICIEQNNNLERNHQVANMKTVYKSAS